MSDIEVFGCEADLFELDTQLPLSEYFHTVLLKRSKLQIIIRPCVEEGHSVWQFQDSDREGYPKAVRVPINARKEVADRAFYAAPMLQHVEVAAGMKHIGFAAWQSCQQLQIVKLPLSVVSLEDGVFQGCYVLKEVVAPGCLQFSRRVFAECCSLFRVGTGSDTDAANDLAPGAQLGPFAFESCLMLTSINFVMDKTNRSRALPDGSFCGSGIESLCLPCDFRSIGPKACENCKRLVEVCTDITAIWQFTFAHCIALADIWLPPKLQRIGKEAFLCCTSLRELVIPTELQYIGIRAFCGCEQLALFTLLDYGDCERTIQAENNAFLMCDNFEKASWVELLPRGDPDSDAFDEELHTELPYARI